MVREELRQAASLARLGLKFLEKAGHLDWVVADTGHDPRTQQVRLPLVSAGKFQQHGIRAEADTQLSELRHKGAPAEQAAAQHGAQLQQVGFRGLIGAVAKSDVGDLVAHHPGELGLVFGGQNQAGVNVGRPARQGKRVDAVVKHYLERVREIAGLGSGSQPVANRLNVAHHFRVAYQLDLFLNLLSSLTSDLNVLLLGEQIETGFWNPLGVSGEAGAHDRGQQEPAPANGVSSHLLGLLSLLLSDVRRRECVAQAAGRPWRSLPAGGGPAPVSRRLCQPGSARCCTERCGL